jgi:lysophospholipase L1-like esterase
MEFRRYVAIGDSTTEGLDDPDGQGGYRGWADRLADHLALAQGQVEYANLAIRGRTTAAVRAEQLAPALALEPDLVTVASGTNDLLRRGLSVDAVLGDVEAMQRAFRDTGATVVTFTMPDLGAVVPLARLVRSRLLVLNQGLREVSVRTGTLLFDLAAHPLASDPRLWSTDRLHANTAGHTRIAAGLASTLGLAGHDLRWAAPLPPAPRRQVVAAARAEVVWWREHFLPWMVRHARGRSSGDGISAKLPQPVVVRPTG